MSDLDQPPRSIRPEPYVPPEHADPAVGLISLAIGISGLVLAFIPLIGFLSWVLSPAAIVTGVMSLKQPVARRLGIAGIVTGTLGLIVCILWAVLVFGFFYAFRDVKDF